ncbi:MAG: NAD-dependent epimerase/dehydratase family protein [Tepidisphaerales bacterium]
MAGATGLVGRHVVEALGDAGHGPIVATFRERKPYEACGTTWVKCDLREPAGAMAALGSVDTAILCAGQLSTSAVLRNDPVSSVLGTLRIVTNLLEAAARLRTARVILIGSCTGYPTLARPAVEQDMTEGEPPSQWFGVGWMHRYLELQLRWHVEHLGLIGTGLTLRPSLVYGLYDDFSPESGHFVPSLIRKAVERARPIDIWGDGEQTRNLLHAADLAKAILTCLEPGKSAFQAFNVASPDEVTVNDVVHHLVELDGFSDALITHDLGRSGGPPTLPVSAAALTAATGWTATVGIREGLAGTLAWYRRNR